MSTQPGRHVTGSDIQRLVDGTMGAGEVRRLVRDLLKNRDRRGRKNPWLAALAILDGEEAAAPAGRPLPDTAYEEALDGALAALGRHQVRWRGEAEWRDRLLAAAHRRQHRVVGSDLSQLFPGVDVETAPGRAYVDALLALSAEERYRNTKQMAELAIAALMMAKNLGWRRADKGRYIAEEAADLQARALAELANADRLNHQTELAEERIGQAAELLKEKGSDDPAIWARLVDVLASVRLDQRQLGEAFDLLDSLCRGYEEMGERHLAGRALISKGIATAYDDRPQEAADLFRAGLARIDPARDPRLVVNAHYELLHCLVDAERFQEASAFLLKSGLRRAFAGDPLNLLKLRWLEGKIFFGLGKLERAEAVFREVQAEFLRHDRTYVAAMLNLELTAVSLRQGKVQQAEAQAAAAFETFQNLGVSYEAQRAVGYLREACRLRRASAALALRVVHFLQRLERDPTLRFVS